MLNDKSVGVLMYDTDHDFVPLYLKHLFTGVAFMNSHNTRAAVAGKFHVFHSRTKKHNNPSQGLELESRTKFPSLADMYMYIFFYVKPILTLHHLD